MNKKIIAVFCVVILMASVFSACGNKGYLLMKDENGNEHAYVTDENGSTVLNEQGDIRVYQTDEHGKIVKDENGKPKENSVKKPKVSVNSDGSVTSSIFTLSPINGWVGDKTGKLVKKGTEDKCYISAEYYTEETDERTFSVVTDEIISNNKGVVDAINTGDYKDQGLEKGEVETNRFNYKGYSAVYMSYTLYSNDVKLIHHAENIYIVTDKGEIYCISYVCGDGVGYDKSFNFLDWANTNIEINK